ncbi:hypothetical protein [Arthrobacter sp. zg-Y1116]|nr:hypothetical protein [Arthrobacter sp. zg-Y1116]
MRRATAVPVFALLRVGEDLENGPSRTRSPALLGCCAGWDLRP